MARLTPAEQEAVTAVLTLPAKAAGVDYGLTAHCPQACG